MFISRDVIIVCITSSTYLAGPLDSLPQTEVDDDPREEEDDRQLPHDRALLFNARRLLEHLLPETQRQTVHRQALLAQV